MDTIEIPVSRGKLVRLLIFSALFLVAGLWMIISQPETSNPVFNNLAVKNAVAIGGCLMGILGIVYFSKKLFDKRPGIVIDDEGVIDNSGAVSAGRIFWADIIRITERTVQVSLVSKQKFITITVKNPGDYIEKQQSRLKRNTMKMNLKYYGSPIHISANALAIKFDDLFKLMTEKMEAADNSKSR